MLRYINIEIRSYIAFQFYNTRSIGNKQYRVVKDFRFFAKSYFSDNSKKPNCVTRKNFGFILGVRFYETPESLEAKNWTST